MILIRGCVPGPKKNILVINKTVKKIKIPQIQASKKTAKAKEAPKKEEKKK
jgi:hypothetical protein